MYLKYIKPILDIIVSFILILLLWPLMIITCIITMIDLGFPIYNERRLREGKNKVTYVMYKFRTKTLIKDGPTRYTRISKIIDRLRLNELPQLFNVLKGQMSIVGPRPFIPGEELPIGEIPEKRYLLKPGITGMAQVHGGRKIYHKQKLKYDEIYYDNVSFMLDLKIILKTFFKIIEVKVDERENKTV